MGAVAVDIVQACKYYGSKNDRICVLDHLDLTLYKGTIYALLGSSGCGKTTLLNCLVGNKILNSGSIKIFDAYSNAKQGISPGLRLTVRETMKYFGWLAGMSTQQIENKLQALVKFLMVRDINIKIKSLSGGEQRRVSFGIVLLYDPQLLILDEPTVGLDPLLRESVWKHLIALANDGRTVLLTTHYIEETKEAHRVGLMRNGYIIADAAPKTLLNKFETGTLEEVFLKLSVLQNKNPNKNEQRFSLKIRDDAVCDKIDCSYQKVYKASMWQKISTLIWKQFVVLFRNIPLLIFISLSAALSVVIFFVCIGHTLSGVLIAVVNYEGNNNSCGLLHCDNAQIGCNYQEAKDSLRNTHVHGYITIKYNYTKALKRRLDDLHSAESWDLDYSTIDVHYDVLVKDIAFYIQKSVIDAYNEFIVMYLRSCNKNPHYSRLPINWKTPVHGEYTIETTQNGGPSYLLMVAFCVAAIVTSCSILVERNEGTFDRIKAMGVAHTEILLSHMFTDFTLTVLQLITSLIAAFVIFQLPYKGSLFLAIILALINTFSGMCYGYAISSLLKSESSAMHAISGSMTAGILLSGTFWPREGMHPILKALAWFLPITQAADGMKNIIHRGWTITKAPVYLGFLNPIAWSVIFLMICIINLKIKEK
ncbi:hypothetical protein RN001_010871 [Aquatica leii]|uniref:ABC transporter domain-containing protein n=1 Tax=Aquatica leii TaxID=1421715 RepID=A0AAN7P1K4_9COLE|nr:hypothetical protein RN001_010871 [Aquatica leii]